MKYIRTWDVLIRCRKCITFSGMNSNSPAQFVPSTPRFRCVPDEARICSTPVAVVPDTHLSFDRSTGTYSSHAITGKWQSRDILIISGALFQTPPTRLFPGPLWRIQCPPGLRTRLDSVLFSAHPSLVTPGTNVRIIDAVMYKEKRTYLRITLGTDVRIDGIVNMPARDKRTQNYVSMILFYTLVMDKRSYYTWDRRTC